MPRIRSIHPDACRSRKLAAVSAEAERVYWRLQPHCDDEGRVEDEPDMLASVMFQVQRSITPEMVDLWLWELHEADLIDRYEAGGSFFIEVRRWKDYQHPQRPKPSPIPPAPGPGSRSGTRRVRDGSATARDPIRYGGEGRGEETDVGVEGESEGEVPPPALSAPPVDNRRGPAHLHAKADALAAKFASPPHLTVVKGATEPAADGVSSAARTTGSAS